MDENQNSKSSGQSTRPKAYDALVEYVAGQGHSVRSFAKENGLNYFAISRWANRHRRPSLSRAIEIEKLTDGAVRAIDWE